MSDVADLVAAVGALDAEIARLEGDERAAAQRRVAALIPPYGAPDAVGWYERWLDATGSQAPKHDLDRALLDLARPSPDRAVAARRVATIEAATRAFPGRYGPTGARRDVTLEARRGLGDLPVGPDLLPALPGCRSRLVDTRVEGNVDPTPTLTVRVCATGLSLDEAVATVLDPPHWTGVSGWCDMVPDPDDSALGPGGRRFLEVVGFGCRPGDFQFRVWLDFTRVEAVGNSRVLTYQMSPPDVQRDLTVHGEGANGLLALDEGSLMVVDEGTRLRFTNTKRLRHATEAMGRAVDVLACAAGFAEMGASFVEHASGGLARAEECD